MAKKLTTREAYRRYRLHQKIKSIYRYCPVTKTVFVPYNDAMKNPDVKELQDKYNYIVQTEIV